MKISPHPNTYVPGGFGGGGEFHDFMKQPFKPSWQYDDPFKKLLKQPFKPLRYWPRAPGRSNIPTIIPRIVRYHPALRWPRMAYDIYQLYNRGWLPKMARPTGRGFYDMTGWSQICDVGYPPGEEPSYIKMGSIAPGLSCTPAALDVPSGAFGDTVDQNHPAWPVDFFGNKANMRWFAVGQNNDVGTTGRMGRNQQWSRPNDSRAKNPVPFIPATVTRALPPLLPKWVDPLSPPPLPGMPDFDPAPPPYPAVPFRDKPQETPESRDSGPQATPKASGPGGPTIIYGGGGVQVGPPHERKRSWDEKLMNLLIKLRGGQLVLAVFNGLTEAKDLVDALVDALPERLRKRAPRGFQQRLEYLWRNRRYIDKSNAVINVLLNHFEDKLIGGIEAAKLKAGTKLGMSSAYGISGYQNRLPSVHVVPL